MKIEKKIKHLKKHFAFKDEELVEVRKMYSRDFFDTEDKGYLKLLNLSSQLCYEYNNMRGGASLNCIKCFFRKRKILRLLFPGHKYLAGGGNQISAIIGLAELNSGVFLNREVSFSKFALVEVDKNVIFGPKVDLGVDYLERKGRLAKLCKIKINSDCWICAGVKIFGNVEIGTNSVLAAGAYAKNDVDSFSLAVGRPCKTIKKLDENYTSKAKNECIFDEQTKQIIFDHAKKVIGKCPKKFVKAVNGEVFNSIGIAIHKLYSLAHDLCAELNNENTTEERKEEILNILFPIHGKNLKIGKNLFVDVIGITVIKDNVTIKDNVRLSGNIIIEDDVVIGNNATIFVANHSVLAKERNVSFSLKQGFYENTQFGYVKLNKGVVVRDNAIIAPNSVVESSIPADCLYVKNKIIK